MHGYGETGQGIRDESEFPSWDQKYRHDAFDDVEIEVRRLIAIRQSSSQRSRSTATSVFRS